MAEFEELQEGIAPRGFEVEGAEDPFKDHEGQVGANRVVHQYGTYAYYWQAGQREDAVIEIAMALCMAAWRLWVRKAERVVSWKWYHNEGPAHSMMPIEDMEAWLALGRIQDAGDTVYTVGVKFCTESLEKEA